MSPFDQSTCLLKTYEQMKGLINESAHKIEIVLMKTFNCLTGNGNMEFFLHTLEECVLEIMILYHIFFLIHVFEIPVL